MDDGWTIDIDADYSDWLWAKDTRFENIAKAAVVVSNEKSVYTQIGFENAIAANTPVFAKAKIARHTNVHGIVKDEAGEPTGELQENTAKYLAYKAAGIDLSTLLSDCIRPGARFHGFVSARMSQKDRNCCPACSSRKSEIRAFETIG